jgi:hypothetical protein
VAAYIAHEVGTDDYYLVGEISTKLVAVSGSGTAFMRIYFRKFWKTSETPPDCADIADDTVLPYWKYCFTTPGTGIPYDAEAQAGWLAQCTLQAATFELSVVGVAP